LVDTVGEILGNKRWHILWFEFSPFYLTMGDLVVSWVGGRGGGVRGCVSACTLPTSFLHITVCWRIGPLFSTIMWACYLKSNPRWLHVLQKQLLQAFYFTLYKTMPLFPFSPAEPHLIDSVWVRERRGCGWASHLVACVLLP
jgi:hypothetical protein